MTLEVQYKIKNNPAYLTYLRQNSQWYKYLNRSPLYFKAFEEEAKSKMSLRFSDKLSNTLKTIEILGNVVSSLNNYDKMNPRGIMMKVISGKYKGLNLNGFTINGTRPTMARIKESLFAMMNGYLEDAYVLDLFAGSGSLGIEALSMGAKHCTFVDNNKIACETVKQNTKKIEHVKIVQMDYLKFLSSTEDTFDVILLDPPYQDNLIKKAIKVIEEKNLLNPEGILVCEFEKEEFSSNFPLWKEKKYGDKFIRIYKNN